MEVCANQIKRRSYKSYEDNEENVDSENLNILIMKHAIEILEAYRQTHLNNAKRCKDVGLDIYKEQQQKANDCSEAIKILNETIVKRENECDCQESARMHMPDNEDDECTVCGKKY